MMREKKAMMCLMLSLLVACSEDAKAPEPNPADMAVRDTVPDLELEDMAQTLDMKDAAPDLVDLDQGVDMGPQFETVTIDYMMGDTIKTCTQVCVEINKMCALRSAGFSQAVSRAFYGEDSLITSQDCDFLYEPKSTFINGVVEDLDRYQCFCK